MSDQPQKRTTKESFDDSSGGVISPLDTTVNSATLMKYVLERGDMIIWFQTISSSGSWVGTVDHTGTSHRYFVKDIA
jgi:hypothetical protein